MDVIQAGIGLVPEYFRVLGVDRVKLALEPRLDHVPEHDVADGVFPFRGAEHGH
jgi:hypothetical protein